MTKKEIRIEKKTQKLIHKMELKAEEMLIEEARLMNQKYKEFYDPEKVTDYVLANAFAQDCGITSIENLFSKLLGITKLRMRNLFIDDLHLEMDYNGVVKDIYQEKTDQAIINLVKYYPSEDGKTKNRVVLGQLNRTDYCFRYDYDESMVYRGDLRDMVKNAILKNQSILDEMRRNCDGDFVTTLIANNEIVENNKKLLFADFKKAVALHNEQEQERVK